MVVILLPIDCKGTGKRFMDSYIVSEITEGLFMIGMERPCHVTISTFDIDMRLFMTDFYDPQNTYDIWYWYIDGSYTISNLPTNVRLHQLEKNHAKFWYIESDRQIRFVVTSANMTPQMTHNCMQSFVSITAQRSQVSEEIVRDYNVKLDKFFSVYGMRLDMGLYKMVIDKLIYNLPNRVNGIERWFMKQDDLLVDSNNITLSYLPMVKKTAVFRTSVPTSNKVIAYYSQDKVSEKTTVIKIPYSYDFHYKLYYTHKCLLVSSNNFSYNHKNNYELGILLYEQK